MRRQYFERDGDNEPPHGDFPHLDINPLSKMDREADRIGAISFFVMGLIAAALVGGIVYLVGLATMRLVGAIL